MFKITYQNNELSVISNESLIPVIRQFLQDFGFEMSGSQQMILKLNKSPYPIIESVKRMIEEYGPIVLDEGCNKIIDDENTSKLEFQNMLAEAKSIKHKDKTYWENVDVVIPMLAPDKSLKWYQKMPVQHAVTLGNTANFSVPGSGKTWMGYSTFFKLKYEKDVVDKLLVVSPLAAFRPWETEYYSMTGKEPNIVRITGTPKERNSIIYNKINYSDIFLISHTMVTNEEDHLIDIMNKFRFMVIVDESHNIKKHDGKRATSLHKIALFARRRMILSGTPIPKNLHDLWSQFTFLYHDESLLHTWPQYEQECKSVNALKDISSKLNPYFVRVSKDVLNLPKPTFNPNNVDGRPTIIQMNPIQRRIYDTIALRIKNNVEQFRSDAVALDKFRRNSMIYLIEAATDPSLLTKDQTYPNDDMDAEGLEMLELLAKYPRLRGERPNKITEAIRLAKTTLDSDGKVIIWCSFINTIQKISQYFDDAGHKSIRIWGDIPRDEDVNEHFNRESEIEKFKTDGNYNILVANPASMAESISLHKVCHHAIYVDRTFNGAHYMQSLERIHRVGLQSDVHTKYDILQSEASIDQTIHERLTLKQQNMEKFLNSKDLKIHGTEEFVKGFDDDYADDFNAVIRDIKQHVGSV